MNRLKARYYGLVSYVGLALCIVAIIGHKMIVASSIWVVVPYLLGVLALFALSLKWGGKASNYKKKMQLLAGIPPTGLVLSKFSLMFLPWMGAGVLLGVALVFYVLGRNIDSPIWLRIFCVVIFAIPAIIVVWRAFVKVKRSEVYVVLTNYWLGCWRKESDKTIRQHGDNEQPG